jgi:hypothetical protein
VSAPEDRSPASGAPVGPELERRLREAVARTEARGEPGAPAVPSPEALHDALTGRLPEAERVRVIDEAARSPEGRRELATLRVALGAAEAAWPDAGVQSRRASWWLRPATAAAAGILLAAGLGGGMWWRMMHESPNAAPGADPLRGAGAEARVTLVAPVVEAAPGAPPTLAWRAVPGAVRYDVEVLAPDGSLIHGASTPDTTLALPAAAVPASGGTYEWWVRARAADGTARRSPTGRIRTR